MKKSNVIGALFVLILGLFLGGFLVHKFKPVPDGMVLVPQSTVDSLDAYILLADSLEVLANLPPDTIKVDSIVYVDKIVYKETTPTAEPDPSDSSVQVYSDSLQVDGEINAWVKFKVRGYVLDNIHWEYTPIIKEITTTIETKIPYPVIETIEVKVPEYHAGHYLSLVAGGNDKMFTFGVDYDLVKKNRIYGLQYRRYGEQSVYGVKIGINLATLFKR